MLHILEHFQHSKQMEKNIDECWKDISVAKKANLKKSVALSVILL
jgi:hypothetical protein